MNDHILNITLKKAMPQDAAEAPAPIAEMGLQFYGEAGNPFLAPRGIFICNGKLIIADTAQNRVFIYNQLPTQKYQKADIVLGQEISTDKSRNAGETVSASTLLYPSGIWTNGTVLIIADAWNHRVLVWNSFPNQNGQAADVVIGQKDFTSNFPNINGIGTNPNEYSLNWPYGVFSNGTKLFIADTGNRRILVFNKIPQNNFAMADEVIGKETFDERDYESNDPIWPYSIKMNDKGQIAITDTQYYRVLLWNSLEEAICEKSEVIIGQPNLESNGQNQFLLHPKENTLSWCYDSCFYKNGIFVADTGNSRILWFDKIPETSNQQANGLIGKKDFYTGSENADTLFGTDKSVYWPFSVCVDETNHLMALADTGNHRIILYQLNA